MNWDGKTSLMSKDERDSGLVSDVGSICLLSYCTAGIDWEYIICTIHNHIQNDYTIISKSKTNNLEIIY